MDTSHYIRDELGCIFEAICKNDDGLLIVGGNYAGSLTRL